MYNVIHFYFCVHSKMKKKIIYTGIKTVTAFYLLFISLQLHAQTCSGVAGSPVWLNNFTPGTYAGDSLPAGKSGYLYTKSGCPANGYYTITNNTANCFGNSWDTVAGNVPTNVIGGSYMLINGSVTAGGTVYTDTINNLCTNTIYGFSAWVFNVSLPTSCSGHPIKPRLTFTAEDIDGSVLGYYNTGEIVEGEPTQYSVVFGTKVASNTVIIRVTDDAPGGCGNVFALDGFNIAPCVPSVTASIQSNFCTGPNSFTTLFATVSPAFSTPAFQWQVDSDTGWADIPGANNLSYVRTADTGAAAVYRFTVTEAGNPGNMNCEIASDTIPLYPGIPTGVVAAGSNSPVCDNSIISLSATAGKGYQWTGPAGFTSIEAAPVFKAAATAAGQYTVVVADGYGCQATATTTVAILPSPVAVVNTTQNICVGDSVILQAGGGDTYTWLPQANLSGADNPDPVAKPVSTTLYTVTAANSNNCTDTASVLVVVNSKPIVSAGEDKAVIRGQSVILDGSIKDSGDVTFSWLASSSLSNIHLLNPAADPVINTDYILTAASGNGCGTSSDTVSVQVYNGLQVPNAFTPNGDGHNDVWHIGVLQAFPGAVVVVYNRYGQKVFESTGGSRDWDGRYKNADQPPGAYPYVIDLKNNSPVIKGVVIIVR
jgi:gliding motility-associated-like protein